MSLSRVTRCYFAVSHWRLLPLYTDTVSFPAPSSNPVWGGEVAVWGGIWSAADTSTILDALQKEQNENGVNYKAPTRSAFA